MIRESFKVGLDEDLLCLQVLLLDVSVARVGILARQSAAGVPPAAVAAVAADPPPLGVEVEEVVGVLLLAARPEDGSNFKLICLGYVMLLLLRRLVGVVVLVAPAFGGREPLLVVVVVLVSLAVVPGRPRVTVEAWADSCCASGLTSGCRRLSRLSPVPRKGTGICNEC